MHIGLGEGVSWCGFCCFVLFVVGWGFVWLCMCVLFVCLVAWGEEV